MPLHVYVIGSLEHFVHCTILFTFWKLSPLTLVYKLKTVMQLFQLDQIKLILFSFVQELKLNGSFITNFFQN